MAEDADRATQPAEYEPPRVEDLPEEHPAQTAPGLASTIPK